ncbi:MAG: hypothetical protein ACPHDQ_04870 [Candidatus Thalassarchaeaceae archaeon]|jgi:hypothetical protein
MTKAVYLVGGQDAVYLALADRFERAGVTLTQNKEDSDLIIAIGANAPPMSETDIAVIPSNFSTPNAKITFRIHDILVPQQVNGWGVEIMSDWINWVKEGSQGNPPGDIEARHWVHIRDATDAIVQISLTDAEIPNGVIDLAGRRAWSSNAVLDEMKLLWRRYTDALYLSHTVESLTNVPSPASQQFEGQISRPNLVPLHNAMIASGREEGWRPLTAMRVGLMELFAHSQDK